MGGVNISYRALYRVWRPQQFIDIIGQQHITRTLKNAIREKRFSHAYLFNGPRGTGKTSASKIMAKAVNCHDGTSEEPCNACTSCVGITNGSILDVVEIDAASNRGVDEIRELRDKVKYAPTEVSYKVYIIDEVHMLTTEAFNALLKTLEEPPSHVIFILATTEPHKLPLTIISRCQRFDFKRITATDTAKHLAMIADESGIHISEKALLQIARFAEGGMRDALSLLDQARSIKDGTIDEEDVLSITGALGSTVFSTIAGMISRNDTHDLLTLIDRLMMDGRDPEKLIQDFTSYLRDMLIFKVAPDLQEIKERQLTDDQFGAVAELLEEPQLFQLIQICSESLQQIKWSTNARIVLELTMIKCTRSLHETRNHTASVLPDTSLLEQRIAKLEARISSLQEHRAESPAATEPVKKAMTKVNRLPSTSKVSPEKIKQIFSTRSEELLKQIKSQWNTILNGVKNQKISVHAWLLDAEVVAVNESVIGLAFKSPIHRETTEKESHRSLIDSVIKSVTGKEFHIVTLMQSDWDQAVEATEQVDGDGDSLTKEAKEKDLVEEAIALFGAEVVEVKD